MAAVIRPSDSCTKTSGITYLNMLEASRINSFQIQPFGNFPLRIFQGSALL
ncbi:unnamed protein product [Dovyalis caffra]|uniref:Uncharacterized protein n=1 Tax=Dovyalis caffra TaxID=77055 RepID=A0AAV1S1H5_9ROSI|nr:unnamed protein product [Dovyalis caffra]